MLQSVDDYISKAVDEFRKLSVSQQNTLRVAADPQGAKVVKSTRSRLCTRIGLPKGRGRDDNLRRVIKLADATALQNEKTGT